jgi:hypothetical protein
MDDSSATGGPQSYRAAAPPSPSGHPERDKGKEIRLAQLFKGGAIQPNDIFHFGRSIKAYTNGSSSDIAVDAQVVVRAQEKSSIKGKFAPIEFDIIENGQRNLLGAFTGPKAIAEALVRKTGGLRSTTPIDGSRAVWEDFEVFRNGQSLGTASDIRNNYYVSTRPSNQPDPSDSDTTPSAPRQPTQATPSLPARSKATHQSAESQVEMEELLDAMPAEYQPERKRQTDTMRSAIEYINFLKHRLSNAYDMITIMGVKDESLTAMLHKMDNGADVAEAMRDGLEWDDVGPLGEFGLQEDESE